MSDEESLLICEMCHTLHDSQLTPVWVAKDGGVEAQCANCRVTMVTAPPPEEADL